MAAIFHTLALQKKLLACASYKELCLFIWRYYDESVVPDMIEILASGHPLSAIAVRHLSFCCVHPDFATDCLEHGVVLFLFQLVRMVRACLLRKNTGLLLVCHCLLKIVNIHVLRLRLFCGLKLS